MTWTDVIDTENTWTSVGLLYVVAGYWEDGYTVDNQNQWTEQLGSSNTWVVIG